MEETTEKNKDPLEDLSELSSSLDYNIKGEDRHFAILYKHIDKLTKEIHELQHKKIIDDSLVENHID